MLPRAVPARLLCPARLALPLGALGCLFLQGPLLLQLFARHCLFRHRGGERMLLRAAHRTGLARLQGLCQYAGLMVEKALLCTGISFRCALRFIADGGVFFLHFCKLHLFPVHRAVQLRNFLNQHLAAFQLFQRVLLALVLRLRIRQALLLI